MRAVTCSGDLTNVSMLSAEGMFPTCYVLSTFTAIPPDIPWFFGIKAVRLAFCSDLICFDSFVFAVACQTESLVSGRFDLPIIPFRKTLSNLIAVRLTRKQFIRSDSSLPGGQKNFGNFGRIDEFSSTVGDLAGSFHLPLAVSCQGNVCLACISRVICQR